MGRWEGGKVRRVIWGRVRVLAYGVATWVCGLRPLPVDRDSEAKHLWPEQTRRTGLRFTERVRDCFRPRWLRIHKPEQRQDRLKGEPIDG